MTLENQIPWREPLTFAAGDMLVFQRNLPDYPPQDGWSLLYEVRGAGIPITFASVQQNDVHYIEVDNPVTQLWPAKVCLLVGFAVNGAERHQIYYGEFQIFPNQGALQNQAPQTTHAQRMIALIEAQLEKLAAHSLQDTDVQQSEVRRVKRLDLERQLAINKELRANEIAQENIRNGRPSGNKIVSQMSIVNTGSSRAVNQTGNLIP